jgi:hypothetical protein
VWFLPHEETEVSGGVANVTVKLSPGLSNASEAERVGEHDAEALLDKISWSCKARGDDRGLYKLYGAGVCPC